MQTLAGTAGSFTIKNDIASGVSFFAGLTDDPFYFDIVGFNRFVASVLAENPDVTALQRARDSFAGYNIHMIVLVCQLLAAWVSWECDRRERRDFAKYKVDTREKRRGEDQRKVSSTRPDGNPGGEYRADPVPA